MFIHHQAKRAAEHPDGFAAHEARRASPLVSVAALYSYSYLSLTLPRSSCRQLALCRCMALGTRGRRNKGETTVMFLSRGGRPCVVSGVCCCHLQLPCLIAITSTIDRCTLKQRHTPPLALRPPHSHIQSTHTHTHTHSTAHTKHTQSTQSTHTQSAKHKAHKQTRTLTHNPQHTQHKHKTHARALSLHRYQLMCLHASPSCFAISALCLSGTWRPRPE